MADWFETRFREPVDAGGLDPAFAARVRALVVEEWQADVVSTPSHDPIADDYEGEIIMLETEDRPRPGTEPGAPRGRSPRRWLAVAAAVAVVALVGALLVTNRDGTGKIDTVTSVPPPPPEPQDIMSFTGFTAIDGTYFIDPDGLAATPLKVTFTVAADGWSSWIGAVKFAPGAQLALSITTVTNVARDACVDHSAANPPVGPTVDDLATALATLAPFELTSAPSDVTVLGYSGKHLELTVPQLAVSGENFTDCTDGSLHSWFSRNNGPFSGYNAEPGMTEEFWILDVDGTRLVLETTQSPDALPEDRAELQAIFDSIQIEP